MYYDIPRGLASSLYMIQMSLIEIPFEFALVKIIFYLVYGSNLFKNTILLEVILFLTFFLFYFLIKFTVHFQLLQTLIVYFAFGRIRISV